MLDVLIKNTGKNSFLSDLLCGENTSTILW